MYTLSLTLTLTLTLSSNPKHNVLVLVLVYTGFSSREPFICLWSFKSRPPFDTIATSDKPNNRKHSDGVSVSVLQCL